jgi:hypothetical protein
MDMGLYTSGMVNFVLDDMALGYRVALWLDEENNCDPLWFMYDWPGGEEPDGGSD